MLWATLIISRHKSTTFFRFHRRYKNHVYVWIKSSILQSVDSIGELQHACSFLSLGRQEISERTEDTVSVRKGKVTDVDWCIFVSKLCRSTACMSARNIEEIILVIAFQTKVLEFILPTIEEHGGTHKKRINNLSNLLICKDGVKHNLSSKRLIWKMIGRVAFICRLCNLRPVREQPFCT